MFYCCLEHAKLQVDGLCVISDLRHKMDRNCSLLGYYAGSSGNFVLTLNPKMRPIGGSKMLVRNYHYSLRYNPEERSSQVDVLFGKWSLCKVCIGAES